MRSPCFSSLKTAAVLLVLGGAAVAPQAQEFHHYLRCKGEVRTKAGKRQPAHLDLALRDNNMSALIQRSDLLPVGERLKYNASQTHYSFRFATPRPGTAIYSNWFGTVLFVSYPEFRRVVETRWSVDRNTAVLEGDMMGLNNDELGTIRMNCEPRKHEDMPAPKF
ncbi:MAG: hypothetical protein ABW190_01100 [Rhizobacter sp.]